MSEASRHESTPHKTGIRDGGMLQELVDMNARVRGDAVRGDEMARLLLELCRVAARHVYIYLFIY